VSALVFRRAALWLHRFLISNAPKFRLTYTGIRREPDSTFAGPKVEQKGLPQPWHRLKQPDGEPEGRDRKFPVPRPERFDATK
jgi:hypothetical protein